MADNAGQIAAQAMLTALTPSGKVPYSWRGVTTVPFRTTYGIYTAVVTPVQGYATFSWGNADPSHTIEVEYEPSTGVISHMAIQQTVPSMTVQREDNPRQYTEGKGGTMTGALAVLAKLAPGGIVPKSWLQGKTLIDVPTGGAYVVQASNGQGMIRWGNLSSDNSLTFAWDPKTGAVHTTKTPDSGSVTEEPLLGIPDAVGSAAQGVASATMSVGDFLSKLSSVTMWKRIGIGAAGVVILLLTFAAIMKRDVL